jgi:hypothetical protein
MGLVYPIQKVDAALHHRAPYSLVVMSQLDQLLQTLAYAVIRNSGILALPHPPGVAKPTVRPACRTIQ